MHWLSLSETGSHFICSNSFIPMWLLLSSWRQNLIWTFNPNVVELLHCIRVLSDTAINIYFFGRGNLAYLVNNLQSLNFPWQVLLRFTTKYVTFEYCLILMLPAVLYLWCSNFLLFVFGRERIDLVLSSPTRMLSLLSANQSYMLQKNFSSLFVWSRSLCWYSKHVSSAYRNRSQSTACGISLIYSIY